MTGLHDCGRMLLPLAYAACIALLPLTALRAQTGADAAPLQRQTMSRHSRRRRPC
ncbi:hypothetical protein [Defluviicoccus vanus]|uniref:Uncharacterized protein n=1 Tax=Defluviicoccus vanus TaxID=111831 RepID=A0A7H1N0W4_9PROT|nr:hypothetical protein [Defluviicoccus vanus]QNT69350.1 hypothetical protein HQ394_08495 [Defluviicoccus vanus]